MKKRNTGERLLSIIGLGTIFIVFQCFAAAPVTHIYFAEKYMSICKPQYTKKERATFKRGTLWPDIRYIAKISRTKTHAKDVKLEDIIKCKDPFTAGKLFHAFLDEQRVKILEKSKVNELLHMLPITEKMRVHFLKVVEDEICYKDIDAKETIAALKTVDKAEIDKGVVMHTARAWHRHLSTYLKQSPTKLFEERIKQKKGYLHFRPELIEKMNHFVKEFAKNKKVIAYWSKLDTELTKMFNGFQKGV